MIGVAFDWIKNYRMFGPQNEEGFDGGGAEDLLPPLAVGRLHLELVVEELQRPARHVNAPVTHTHTHKHNNNKQMSSI